MRNKHDPWADIETRGIEIIETSRRALKGQDGLRYSNTIYIANDLTGRELISILWHELGHHAHDDTCFPKTWLLK